MGMSDIKKEYNIYYEKLGMLVSRINYSSIYHDIQPLSILLFNGNDVCSELVEWIESKRVDPKYIKDYGLYSHCGIIVNKQLFPNVSQMEDGKLYVFEMKPKNSIFTKDAPDIETNTDRNGLQIRDLESVVKTYQGRIALLKLKINPLEKMEDETMKDYQIRIQDLVFKSQNFKDQYTNTYNESNPLKFFASVFSEFRWVRNYLNPSKGSKSNAQIVIEYLQILGIFDTNINSEDVIPQDFIFDADKKISNEIYPLPPIEIIPK